MCIFGTELFFETSCTCACCDHNASLPHAVLAAVLLEGRQLSLTCVCLVRSCWVFFETSHRLRDRGRAQVTVYAAAQRMIAMSQRFRERLGVELQRQLHRHTQHNFAHGDRVVRRLLVEHGTARRVDRPTLAAPQAAYADHDNLHQALGNLCVRLRVHWTFSPCLHGLGRHYVGAPCHHLRADRQAHGVRDPRALLAALSPLYGRHCVACMQDRFVVARVGSRAFSNALTVLQRPIVLQVYADSSEWSDLDSSHSISYSQHRPLKYHSTIGICCPWTASTERTRHLAAHSLAC